MDLLKRLPVRLHVFNRRWVLRDPINREVIEILMTSNSIDYVKRMTEVAQFIGDLINGRKSVAYDNDSKSYSVEEHRNAPEPVKAMLIPGLTQSPPLPGIPANVSITPEREKEIAELAVKGNGHQPEKQPIVESVVGARKAKPKGKPKRK